MLCIVYILLRHKGNYLLADVESCFFYLLAKIFDSDATIDVITSNLMFLTHQLMFDVFVDEFDVKQSDC